MSPRSTEFMAAARDQLAAARAALGASAPSGAVSSAYYAMLNAALAALSEHDEHARTHAGVWHLFHERFVVTGQFPAELHREAQRSQEDRIGADYRAVVPGVARAAEVVEVAERFVDEVATRFGDQPRDDSD
ncbi:MAG: HEPN domain-containing protein [Solirubrobacteraceae bacterium]